MIKQKSAIEIPSSLGDTTPYFSIPEMAGCENCGLPARLFISKPVKWSGAGGLKMFGVRLAYKCECGKFTYFRMYGPEISDGKVVE